MTPAQVQAVRQSFALVAPKADSVGLMFYKRLFELDPGLRSLFKSDIDAQSKKLMQMLAAAVDGLDRLESIVPAVQSLGARHAAYGVAEAHYDYDTVAAALLWTLEQELGAEFTPAVREAWIAAYQLLAETMKGAGRNATSATHSPNAGSQARN